MMFAYETVRDLVVLAVCLPVIVIAIDVAMSLFGSAPCC